VNIFDSEFRNAQGDTIFSSDGGSLVVQNTNFVDVDVASIGAVGTGGVMSLKDVEINGGSMEVSYKQSVATTMFAFAVQN